MGKCDHVPIRNKRSLSNFSGIQTDRNTCTQRLNRFKINSNLGSSRHFRLLLGAAAIIGNADGFLHERGSAILVILCSFPLLTNKKMYPRYFPGGLVIIFSKSRNWSLCPQCSKCPFPFGHTNRYKKSDSFGDGVSKWSRRLRTRLKIKAELVAGSNKDLSKYHEGF